MADPDLFQFLLEISTEEDALEFCRKEGLIQAPRQAPIRDPLRRAGNINEYWGVCSELGFNPMIPQCDGRVTTLMRRSPSGPKPHFRCVKCRKQLSQLHGLQPVARAAHHGTWFASLDDAGRPNTKLLKQAILWIMYAMMNNMSIRNTIYFARNTIPVTKSTVVDWRNYVRELFLDALHQAAPMGGPGEVVEIDESLFRGKRKYNRGRVLLGNQIGGAVVGVGGAAVGVGGAAAGVGGAAAGVGGAAVRVGRAAARVGGAAAGVGGAAAGIGGAAVGVGGAAAGVAGAAAGIGGAAAGVGGAAVGVAAAAAGVGGAGVGVGGAAAGVGGAAVGAGGAAFGVGGGGGAAGVGQRNHGRRIEGPWVFGMMLRRTGELRLFHVQKRDAATLIPLIRRHVAAGTTIYSDEWAAYQNIGRIPGTHYVHRTVNHQVHIYPSLAFPFPFAYPYPIKYSHRSIIRKYCINSL